MLRIFIYVRTNTQAQNVAAKVLRKATIEAQSEILIVKLRDADEKWEVLKTSGYYLGTEIITSTPI